MTYGIGKLRIWLKTGTRMWRVYSSWWDPNLMTGSQTAMHINKR